MKFIASVATITTIAASCSMSTTKDNSFQKNEQVTGSVQNVSSDTISTNQVVADIVDTFYINSILHHRDSLDRKISTLEKVKMNIDGSAEGGEATLYLASEDTLKMDFTFYGEMGKSNHIFYLKQGNPVYYLAKTIMYTESIAVGRDIKVDSTSIDEIVFLGSRIVDWKQNNKIVGKELFRKKEQDIDELLGEMRSLLVQ